MFTRVHILQILNTQTASGIHFLLGINVAITRFVLKSISEAGNAPDGQVWAIYGHLWPLHGLR